MKVFTIGFTKKNARQFFDALRKSGAKRVVDVRLNNVSQLTYDCAELTRRWRASATQALEELQEDAGYASQDEGCRKGQRHATSKASRSSRMPSAKP